MSKSTSSRGDTCPYYRYGQCLLVPVHLAYTIVNTQRCLRDWRTCKYYLNASGGSRASEKRILKGNSTLEGYVQKAKQVNSIRLGRCKVKSLKDFIGGELKKSRRLSYEKLKRILESLKDGVE